LGIALRRQVKYIIGTGGLYAILDRHRVSQVGIMKLNSAAGVDIIKMTRNIIQGTSPTKHAMDFPIGMLEKVIQEMRADHSCYARDQGALSHFISRFGEGDRGQTTKNILNIIC